MPPKRRRQALTSDGVGTLLRSSPTETADAPILQVVELQRLALDARWLHAAREAFFGPFRVSAMLDPNGCNTTAAAAVVKLVKAAGGDVHGLRAVVLAGTGPVGARAAGLLLHIRACQIVADHRVS